MATFVTPYYWPMPTFSPYGGYASYSPVVGYGGGYYYPYSQPVLPKETPRIRSAPKIVPRNEVPLRTFVPLVEKRLEAKASGWDRFFVRVSYAAMVGNLLGGLSLAVSTLPRLAPAWKTMLKNGGLKGIAFAVGLGSLAELGVGIKQKQPTVAIANSIFILATPYFMKDTPMARGLFLFLMGLYYSGYANIIGNKFETGRKTPRRESEAPISDMARTAQFIADDHRMMLKTIPQVPSLLGGLAMDLKRAAEAVSRGEKLYIEPSSQRVRLSALCHYVGGALLMLAKRRPLLLSLGSIMAGIGGVSSNLEWFAVGTQRTDAIGTALKVGMPMQALGKMFFHTNAGYGVEVMGQGLSYALTTELNQSKPEQSPIA